MRLIRKLLDDGRVKVQWDRTTVGGRSTISNIDLPVPRTEKRLF